MNELSTTPSMAEYYQMIKAEHEANNAWSAEQAQKAMDYQTEMSNTAHVREVADLKAAGLNPVLSAGGAGATTGSGIAAQRSDENVQALYGLAKQAIEANIEQAQAMATTAKASSGSSGGYRSSGGAASVQSTSLWDAYGMEQNISDSLQAMGFKKNQAEAAARLATKVEDKTGILERAMVGVNKYVTKEHKVKNALSNVKLKVTGKSVSNSAKAVSNKLRSITKK